LLVIQLYALIPWELVKNESFSVPKWL